MIRTPRNLVDGSFLHRFRRRRGRLSLRGRLVGLRKHGLLSRAEHGEEVDGGHLEAAEEAAEEALVGLRPGGHGLELREVVGAVEAALVDGAGEVVELQLPLLLEVAVGLERRRDLVGPHEEPGVHAPRAGLERLPPRPRHGGRHFGVLRHHQPRSGPWAGAMRGCCAAVPP